MRAIPTRYVDVYASVWGAGRGVVVNHADRVRFTHPPSLPSLFRLRSRLASPPASPKCPRRSRRISRPLKSACRAFGWTLCCQVRSGGGAGGSRMGRGDGEEERGTSHLHFHPSCHTVLIGVPATKPLSELQAPVTKMTTLENGLRVATQETYGAVSQQRIAWAEWGRASMHPDHLDRKCVSKEA